MKSCQNYENTVKNPKLLFVLVYGEQQIKQDKNSKQLQGTFSLRHLDTEPRLCATCTHFRISAIKKTLYIGYFM